MDIYTHQTEANCTWMIFWLVYWTGGFFLSLYSSRKCICFDKVRPNLYNGMLITWIGTNLVAVLPIRGSINYDIDSWLQIIWEPIYKIGISLLIIELWFYHAHVLLHQPQFYMKFHKQHHEFKKPYPLSGLYCSTYEMIICNLLSTTLGPILTNLHGMWLYFWFTLVSINVLLAHSPLSNHDLHHRLLSYNYGVLNIFDSLYGTWYDKSLSTLPTSPPPI